MALDLFAYQQEDNVVLREFVLCSGRQLPQRIDEIPFLPVELFKTHDVVCGHSAAQAVFTSSGTAGMSASRHIVTDLSVYETAYREGFRLFYGEPSEYCILALLPSYMEREGSSLVHMAEGLVQASGHPLSGFYLYDHEKLFDTLIRLKARQQKTLLIGVTFALLDFAAQYQLDWPELIVMETGGMKGRRQELIREEVHAVLKDSFALPAVHSEYGMTELLSQAYSQSNGIFRCPPWMRVIITDANDPFRVLPVEKTGVINVIDLANMHSCAFIKTSDLGRRSADGSFTVLGRMDLSDTRGCSLLYV